LPSRVYLNFVMEIPPVPVALRTSVCGCRSGTCGVVAAGEVGLGVLDGVAGVGVALGVVEADGVEAVGSAAVVVS
jgi:hypothetical protein